MAITLKQLVSQQTGNAAEIAAALNAKTQERKHSQEVGYRGITIKHGPTFAGTILAKLDAAGASNPLLKATYTAVCTTGIDFSAAVTQGMIDQLEAAKLFTADEATKLKAIGIWHISICEANSLPDATEDAVQAAIDEIETETAAENAAAVKSQLIAYAVNEVLAVANLATWAELQSAIAANEGPI